MSSSGNKIFFPGLNGLRFIAAFLVIIHHIEQDKWKLGYVNAWDNKGILNIGALGVVLFFVLSGFLITYLLLAEKENFGTVSIKKFYIRRILRIWPLYYLIVILALYILPRVPFFYVPEWTDQVQQHLGVKTILFLLILPNVSMLMFPPVVYGAQTWSIGIEEQFYLMWPLIIRYTKKYLRILLFILFFIIFTNNLLGIIADKKYIDLYPTHVFTAINLLKGYFETLWISAMAIGGIGAYLLYYRKEKHLAFVYSRPVQFIAYAVILFFIFSGIKIPFINAELVSVFFCIIILNVASNPKTIISFEHPVLDYLGKISYGVYMFHNIAIVACIKLLVSLLGLDFTGPFQYLILLSSVTTLTIVMADISFRFFEQPFLKLKNRFTKIVSGGV